MINHDISNSMKDTRDSFLQIERKYGLLDYRIEGLEIWQCIRNALFNQIISIQNGFHTAHASMTKKERLRFIPQMIFNSIFKNPFFTKKNIETIFYENSRKVKVQQDETIVSIDPYTHYYIEGYKKEYEVFEDMYLYNHEKSLYSTNRYLDIFSFYHFFIGKRKKNKLSTADISFINQVNREINDKLNTDIDLLTEIKVGLINYRSQYLFYKKLFKKIKPKQLYLVCSYGKGGLIKAAKENNVTVIEFQHGFINSYHMGYHFPTYEKKDSLVTFPNQLYLFGQFWADYTSFPITDKNLIMHGYPYLLDQIKKTTILKNRKKIIFISQGTIGKELSKFFYEVAKKLPDYQFIYKLHPGEIYNWESNYPLLIRAQTLDNVEIREKSNIYEDFSESMIQVGVYSTALFEGIAFNCKTILLSLPGIEYMGDLIKTNYVQVVSNVEEFKNAIQSDYKSELSSEYFFHKVDEKVKVN